MLLIVHADEHFYLRMLIQHDFGDSSDEDDGGSVCILGWKKKTALGTGEGKDLCIIKQAPKDAALLACLSCAIRTLLVIVRLVILTIHVIVRLLIRTLLVILRLAIRTILVIIRLPILTILVNTHHQTNRKKTMSAENIVCSKQSHFTLTRCPRIVVAWNCLCQCLQRLS